MALIEWTGSFRLGIDPFDEHHQHLVELLNESYDQVVGGSPAESVGMVLSELIDYATYHFGTEERWMSTVAYPEIDRHKAEHDQFISRVTALQKEFIRGKTDLAEQVLSFLTNWLIEHILRTDRAYARCLNEQKERGEKGN